MKILILQTSTGNPIAEIEIQPPANRPFNFTLCREYIIAKLAEIYGITAFNKHITQLKYRPTSDLKAAGDIFSDDAKNIPTQSKDAVITVRINDPSRAMDDSIIMKEKEKKEKLNSTKNKQSPSQEDLSKKKAQDEARFNQAKLDCLKQTYTTVILHVQKLIKDQNVDLTFTVEHGGITCRGSYTAREMFGQILDTMGKNLFEHQFDHAGMSIIFIDFSKAKNINFKMLAENLIAAYQSQNLKLKKDNQEANQKFITSLSRKSNPKPTQVVTVKKEINLKEFMDKYGCKTESEALIIAIRNGEPLSVKHLIELGVKVNENVLCPATCSSPASSRSALSYLLDVFRTPFGLRYTNFPPNFPKNEIQSLTISEKSCIEMMGILFRAGAKILEDDYWMLFRYSCSHLNSALFEALLDYYSPPRSRPPSLFQPFTNEDYNGIALKAYGYGSLFSILEGSMYDGSVGSYHSQQLISILVKKGKYDLREILTFLPLEKLRDFHMSHDRLGSTDKTKLIYSDIKNQLAAAVFQKYCEANHLAPQDKTGSERMEAWTEEARHFEDWVDEAAHYPRSALLPRPSSKAHDEQMEIISEDAFNRGEEQFAVGYGLAQRAKEFAYSKGLQAIVMEYCLPSQDPSIPELPPFDIVAAKQLMELGFKRQKEREKEMKELKELKKQKTNTVRGTIVYHKQIIEKYSKEQTNVVASIESTKVQTENTLEDFPHLESFLMDQRCKTLEEALSSLIGTRKTSDHPIYKAVALMHFQEYHWSVFKCKFPLKHRVFTDMIHFLLLQKDLQPYPNTIVLMTGKSVNILPFLERCLETNDISDEARSVFGLLLREIKSSFESQAQTTANSGTALVSINPTTSKPTTSPSPIPIIAAAPTPVPPVALLPQFQASAGVQSTESTSAPTPPSKISSETNQAKRTMDSAQANGSNGTKNESESEGQKLLNAIIKPQNKPGIGVIIGNRRSFIKR